MLRGHNSWRWLPRPGQALQLLQEALQLLQEALPAVLLPLHSWAAHRQQVGPHSCIVVLCAQWKFTCLSYLMPLERHTHKHTHNGLLWYTRQNHILLANASTSTMPAISMSCIGL